MHEIKLILSIHYEIVKIKMHMIKIIKDGKWKLKALKDWARNCAAISRYLSTFYLNNLIIFFVFANQILYFLPKLGIYFFLKITVLIYLAMLLIMLSLTIFYAEEMIPLYLYTIFFMCLLYINLAFLSVCIQ